MKLSCENCGTLEYALIDGYKFGDRLLEGVMFKIAGGEKVKATLADGNDDAYFKNQGISKKKWLIAAVAYAIEDADSLECPICKEHGGFVSWEEAAAT